MNKQFGIGWSLARHGVRPAHMQGTVGAGRHQTRHVFQRIHGGQGASKAFGVKSNYSSATPLPFK